MSALNGKFSDPGGEKTDTVTIEDASVFDVNLIKGEIFPVPPYSVLVDFSVLTLLTMLTLYVNAMFS